MKPILNIFIFIFSVLQSRFLPLSNYSKKSKNPNQRLGFSSNSTFSIGGSGSDQTPARGGGDESPAPNASRPTGKVRLTGEFSAEGGGVRKTTLYSIYTWAGMIFRGFADFEGAVDEEEGLLVAYLIGGNGGSRKLVAEGVISAGSFELEGGANEKRQFVR